MDHQYTNGHDFTNELPEQGFPQDLPRASIAPSMVPVDYSHLIAVISAWKGILNARLLAVMAMIGALAIFGLAAYDPTNLRLTAGSLYSIGVLWPVIWLFMRKG